MTPIDVFYRKEEWEGKKQNFENGLVRYPHMLTNGNPDRCFEHILADRTIIIIFIETNCGRFLIHDSKLWYF